MSFNVRLSLQLAAADDNGISLSQNPGASADLLINGALATAGVATLDVARRVYINSAGDDTLITFTIYGTDRYGRTIQEALAGANIGNAISVKDYKTVTRIATTGNAGTVIAGTGSIGSSTPQVLDAYTNPSVRTAAIKLTGTVNWTLEVSADDRRPEWDLDGSPVTWFNLSGFTALATNQAGTFPGSWTLIRLTNNSGTGLAEVDINTPYISN